MPYIYNSPVNFNIPQIGFKSKPEAYSIRNTLIKDSFSTNPIYESFETKAQLEHDAKTNPKIQNLLKEYNLPVKVNLEELENLKQGHLKDTRIVAAKIYSSLPENLKSQANLKQIQDAAMLHDYGKVLIPHSILNKSEKLTDKERKIMELHSELGYELLKNKGFDKETLNLIKYHHQTPDYSGYPAINNDYEYNIDAQILNAADKYTALREKRSYKDEMSHKEALDIIKQDATISSEIYNALEKFV